MKQFPPTHNSDSEDTVIQFKPLEEKDFPLIITWFKQPHVAPWWPTEYTLPPEQIRKKYQDKLQSPYQNPYIIYFDNQPIGYIQSYNASIIADWLVDEPEGTYGIDLFIGELAYLGKGLGTEIIRDFITKLFQDPNIKKIITDANPDNERAIRCYEKIGFQKVRFVTTPDGAGILMAITRQAYKK